MGDYTERRRKSKSDIPCTSCGAWIWIREWKANKKMCEECRKEREYETWLDSQDLH